MIDNKKLGVLLASLYEEILQVSIRQSQLDLAIQNCVDASQDTDSTFAERFHVHQNLSAAFADAVILRIRQKFEPLIQQLKNGRF